MEPTIKDCGKSSTMCESERRNDIIQNYEFMKLCGLPVQLKRQNNGEVSNQRIHNQENKSRIKNQLPRKRLRCTNQNKISKKHRNKSGTDRIVRKDHDYFKVVDDYENIGYSVTSLLKIQSVPTEVCSTLTDAETRKDTASHQIVTKTFIVPRITPKIKVTSESNSFFKEKVVEPETVLVNKTNTTSEIASILNISCPQLSVSTASETRKYAASHQVVTKTFVVPCITPKIKVTSESNSFFKEKVGEPETVLVNKTNTTSEIASIPNISRPVPKSMAVFKDSAITKSSTSSQLVSSLKFNNLTEASETKSTTDFKIDTVRKINSRTSPVSVTGTITSKSTNENRHSVCLALLPQPKYMALSKDSATIKSSPSSRSVTILNSTTLTDTSETKSATESKVDTVRKTDVQTKSMNENTYNKSLAQPPGQKPKDVSKDFDTIMSNPLSKLVSISNSIVNKTSLESVTTTTVTSKLIDKNSVSETKKLRNNFKCNKFRCNVCGQPFINRADLERHNNNNNFTVHCRCHYCGKSFMSSHSLNVHLYKKVCTKPHKCAVCSRAFADGKDLKVHSLKHTEHKCDVCGKRFSRRCTLNQHFLVHKDEKPYKCELCDKKYSRSSGLKQHRSIHIKWKT